MYAQQQQQQQNMNSNYSNFNNFINSNQNEMNQQYPNNFNHDQNGSSNQNFSNNYNPNFVTPGMSEMSEMMPGMQNISGTSGMSGMPEMIPDTTDDSDEKATIPIPDYTKLNESISRIVHQTFKDEPSIPAHLRPCQETFIRFHPSFEYMFWSDEDLHKFISQEYPWFLPTYDSYPHHIQRVDSARYFLLYHFGGVYADLDMQCLTPLDPLLNELGGVVLGQENQQHTDGSQRVGNAFMMSCPGHPFWISVFQALILAAPLSDITKIQSVFKTTGPSFLHETYSRNPQGVTVMPASAFYPKQWHEPLAKIELATRKQYPKSWTVHHWAGLWRSSPRQKQLLLETNNNTQTLLTICLPRKKEQGWGKIENTIWIREAWPQQPVLDLWMSLLEPGHTVVHVGAYIGHFTIPLAHLVGPTGRVYAFEPDARARNLLLDGVRANHMSERVQVYDIMPCQQMTRLYLANKFQPSDPQTMIWRAQPNGQLNCQGSPLDSLKLDKCDLIHIQAQGEEYSVIQGAANLLKQFKPILTVDIWNDDKRNIHKSPLRMDQTFWLLKSLGYNYSVCHSSVYLCTPSS